MGQWLVFSLFDQSQAEGGVSPQTYPFFDDHCDANKGIFQLSSTLSVKKRNIKWWSPIEPSLHDQFLNVNSITPLNLHYNGKECASATRN